MSNDAASPSYWANVTAAAEARALADVAAENTRLRQQVADLETEANTLAASLRLAATLIRPNRESQ